MKKKIILVLSLIILDQLTKFIIVKTMHLGQSIVIIEDFFSFTYHLNEGAAWSILVGKMFLFYTLTIFTIGGISYYLYKNPNLPKIQKLGMLLYISGAIGNLIDRIRIKAVIDFLDFEIPVINYDFPIFNVADSLLVIGVIVIMITTLIGGENETEA